MSVSKLNTGSLINFVVMNHDYIKNSLLKGLKVKRKELLASQPGLFIDDIEKQFLDRAKWVLASDITARSNVPVDEVLAFVETINMEDLLND